MMQKKGSLGRGLGSLIPTFDSRKTQEEGERRPAATSRNEMFDVAIDKISPNPKQPRESFSHEEMVELISSIKEHGVLQPLILTPKDDGYEIIAGERRWRASKAAGLRAVPAMIRNVKEQEKLEISLIENIQRQNLSPIEEAKAYKRLMDEFNFTQEEVAKKVGKSRPQVANFIRLLALPLEIQEAVAAGELPYTQARTLLALDSPRACMKLFRKIIKEKLTVRDTEKKVGPRAKIEEKRDLEITEKEERLRDALGTRVSIKKRGQSGQVIIEFYSDEELGEIVDRISG
ncbi:ParB/RepB/Spo0J family partition protein [Patescibacteria group bacterium]|nr:ParB/RepB/Spo0J family partition protein [Patescibacteria group bacterium]